MAEVGVTAPLRKAVSTSQQCSQHRALSGVHAAALTAPRLRPVRRRGAEFRAHQRPASAAVYSAPNMETRTLFKRRFREPRQTVLFYCPEMADLAKRIAAENDSITLGEIKWEKFKDGFPNLFVQDAGSIRGIHVAFLASFHCASVIFEQMSIIYALPKMFVASFTLVLPFFPTGTLERVENEGEIATAFTLARILSNTPLSRSGPAELVIFDIHALQERFYFGDLVQPNFQSGLPLLLRTLQNLPDGMNVVVAYPDEGAWKRFHWQLRAFSLGSQEVICTKVREGDQRIVKLKEGNPMGRHVVIVDDLVQSGSTLIECQKMLASLGAAKVSAYVTHGVFPEDSWKRFVPEKGGGAKEGFTHFWITDSIPTTVAKVTGHAPFEVLSLAKPIAQALA